ncbi:MAG TPA: lysophospholipid acyltransferase family protein [Burkholderiaceae bacterium]|nr:lysophospholipid acyltransferase family protein [Burkholderiaceae bacterium]
MIVLHGIWYVVESLWLYAGLALLAFMSLAYNLGAAVVALFVRRRDRAHALGRRGIMHGYRLYWRFMTWARLVRLDLSALDTLRDAGPLIIAPNHPALLDAVLVVSRLPVVCLMKSSVVDNVFLGAGARLAGYIRNEPVHGMIKRAVKELGLGSQLLIFPEGTRTTETPVNPFKRGIALIACKARAPVQTVFIEARSGYLSKGWKIWRKPPLPLVYRIRLGERFIPGDDPDAFLARLEAYFRDELMNARPNASAEGRRLSVESA